MMNDFFSIVILAGGLATRLRPKTEKIPKSLIEVNDEPFVAHQLRLLQKQGIKQVVMCIGYLGEQIESYVGTGKQFGMQVEYVKDGEKLLGTAGCIKKALPFLSDNFFVLYGDSYLNCDYMAIKKYFLDQQKHAIVMPDASRQASNLASSDFSEQKLALMTVFRNEGQWDTSNIEFQHNQIIAYDKKNKTDRMQYIDFGLGILNKKAFDLVPNNEVFDLALLYQMLLQKKQLAGYEVKERFYEVGSFAGIEELSHYLKRREEHAIHQPIFSGSE